MLRSDDVSDARANDRHVCPTTQPFIPNWTTLLVGAFMDGGRTLWVGDGTVVAHPLYSPSLEA